MGSIFGGAFSGTNSGDLFGFATGGMFAGTMEAKKSRQDQERLATQARMDADAKAAAIQANIGKLRAQYGIWDGDAPSEMPQLAADPGKAPPSNNPAAYSLWNQKNEAFQKSIADQAAWKQNNQAYTDAMGNKQRLANLFDTTAKTWQQNQNTGLQDSFAGTLNQNKFQMARQGMVGSGVDANQQSDLFGNYLKARGGITEQAAGIKDTLQASLDTQRQDVERGLVSGSVLDLSGINSLNAQGQALKEATANIPAQSFGQALATGGQLGGVNAQAQGLGYAGYQNYPGMNQNGGLWSGRSSSAPSSSGSTTGRR